MTPAESVIVTLLGAYLVVTVLAQLPKGGFVGWLKRRDVFSLIPAYTFFAPNPGVSDFVVIYRDELTGGGFTNWTMLDQGDPGVGAPFWNPSKRRQKLITDLASGMLAGASAEPDFLLDIGYIGLLALVERANHDFRAVRTQFALVSIEGARASMNPSALFTSALIPLGIRA